MKKLLIACFVICCFSFAVYSQIPTTISVSIVKAEDERRFDKTLTDLLKNRDEKIRTRAALAAGRIGDESRGCDFDQSFRKRFVSRSPHDGDVRAR